MLWWVLLSIGLQQPTLADRLVECSQEADSLRRLACYDELANEDATEEAGPLESIPPAEFDIEAALQRGLAKERAGLVMADTMASLGSSSGFSLRVHTPRTWIQDLGWEAADRFLSLSVDELEADDLRDVMRIVVYPDTPDKITSQNLASGVKHVVVRDADKATAIQPLVLEVFSETVGNALGAELEYAGVTAVFDMREVRRIREIDKKGEFHITVVGDKWDKDFKVKTKHFDDLGWEKP